PTRTGRLNSKSSTNAVTHGRPAWRCAQMAAHRSIHAMICPPKTLPAMLACCGSTYSTMSVTPRSAAWAGAGSGRLPGRGGAADPPEERRAFRRGGVLLRDDLHAIRARWVERHAPREQAPVAREHHVDRVARAPAAQHRLDPTRGLDARA